MTGDPNAPHFPRSAPIDAYGKGGFAFAGMSHRGSLLCLPNAIWAWEVTDPAQIDRYSLDKVFAAANSIDTLLVGTGTGVWLPPPALRQALKAVRVVLDTMQTRAELYEFLDYHSFEAKLDQLFAKEKQR